MNETIRTTIITILKHLGFPESKVFAEDVVGQTVYRIETDNPKLLIGTHGETLRSLEYLTKKIVESQGVTDMHFVVDVDGYKSAHIKDIQQKALMMAERAKAFAYDVELNPMSAYERLIVHAALTNVPNITTESRGEGKDRRVVIQYHSDGATITT